MQTHETIYLFMYCHIAYS